MSDPKKPDAARQELERTAQDALDALARFERLLNDIGKDNLRNLVELIPQTAHDMRMAQIRLQALLPRPTRTNPDETPTEPIIGRRKSSQFSIKKPE